MGVSCLNELDVKIQYILEIHNVKRGLHKSPPLIQNNYLNELAKEYAKKLSNGQNCFKTFNEKPLGENIYIVKGINFEVFDMCTNWYNEIKNYDKNNASYQRQTSHFTQMIWKNTKEIGFGLKRKDGIYYGVVLYYPAGNILGEYEENVVIN